MIVHICIHVPDLKPDTNEAVTTTDTIESHLCGKLNTLMKKIDPGNTTGCVWWIDVENGETRYAPAGSIRSQLCFGNG